MPLKIVKVVIYGLSETIDLSTNAPSYQPEYSGIETTTFKDDSNFTEIYNNWEPDIVVVIGNLNHFPIVSRWQEHLKSKLYLLSKQEWECNGSNYYVEEFFNRYIKNSITNYNSLNKISVYTASCNTKDRIRVAIMASGFGSNASALIEFSKNISCSYEIVVCISNKENPGVKTVASKNAIPFEYCPELQETQENNKASISLQRLLQVYKIDIIALSGYLKLIPPEITIMFKDRILNIHPSLLPKYGGKGMYGIKVHNAVLQDFNKETGASVHLVNEKYDEGRILGSSRIIINENCSAEELNEKVKNIENILYPDILHNYCKQFYSHS